MKKKEVNPEDVKPEDIAKDIEKSLYGVEASEKNKVFKLMTFIMMFLFYLCLSIIVENPVIRIPIIVFGIIILLFTLQEVVLPAFNNHKKRKRIILEP